MQVVKNGVVDGPQKRAVAARPPAPTPRLRLPLRTTEDVLREAGRVYRAARAGQLSVADAARFTFMLSTIAKLIETSDLARRVELLEQAEQEARAWRRH